MEEVDLSLLVKPFAEHELEWRPQTAGVYNGGPKAMVLAYVTARAIMDRLDEAVGSINWRDEYIHTQHGVMCGLSISTTGGEWVTKWDGAEETQVEAFKGGISSALKRAAVKWGVGRYLYKLGDNWVNVHPQKPNVAESWRVNRIYQKASGNKPEVKGYFIAPELPAWAKA